ncbi:uncharacterized protein LOC8267739 isoform X3 [Ricinus communis]|uniref:uncharacterized protein LOC8267739 isoform X3 n=1 Tax=Ricinus communis TaxID=3988 RepID=UPI00201A6315|nr:uncharacterized protein LOC8267739 isoform X3 [Ricinus communis]
MNHLMPKMSRKTLIHLLLVCLLLVAYLHHFSTQIKVPATESGKSCPCTLSYYCIFSSSIQAQACTTKLKITQGKPLAVLG